MSKPHTYILPAILVASVLCAVWQLNRRVQTERYNRTVAIAVDYQAVQRLAALSGRSTENILRRMKSVGATHAIIGEQRLSELMHEDIVRPVHRRGRTELFVASSVRSRVISQVTARFPSIDVTKDATLQLPETLPVQSISSTGVGYSREDVTTIKRSGLKVVVRPATSMLVTKHQIDAAVGAAADTAAQILIFSGNTVAGLPDLIKYTADRIQRHNLLFGYVELTRQKGERALAGALDHNIVRCHSISPPEMKEIAPHRAVQRYSLAVRERNVRLCYIRPFLTARQNPVNAAVEYVSLVAQEICRHRFHAGSPHPFSTFSVDRWVLPVILLGICAGGIWLIGLLFALPARVFWMLLVVSVVASVVAPFAAADMIAHIAALAAAVLFPILAMARLKPPLSHSDAPSFWKGVAIFVVTCAITIAGAILAAAALSDIAHITGVSRFRGVKLAMIAPVLITFGLFAARCTGAWRERSGYDDGTSEWPALRAGIAEAGKIVVRYWHVALGLLAFGAAAIMVMRSGNVSAVQPSQIEIQFRALLQDVLIARPRFKEFMIGHPALIIAAAFMVSRRSPTFWLLAAIGTVGQVSIMNTFAHIHTPLLISALRTVNGIIIGIIIAAILWLLVRCVHERLLRPQDDTAQ